MGGWGKPVLKVALKTIAVNAVAQENGHFCPWSACVSVSALTLCPAVAWLCNGKGFLLPAVILDN